MLYSLLASLCATAAALLARLLWDVQPLPEQALGRVVQLIPVGLFEWGIRTLGGAAKLLLFLGLLTLEAAVLTIIGYYWLRRDTRRPSFALAGLLLSLLLLAVAVLMPLLGLGALGARSPAGVVRAVAGPLLTYAVWAAGLLAARRLLLLGRGNDLLRRKLVFAGGGWAALTVLGLGGTVWMLVRRSTLTRVGWGPSRTPEVTPVKDFYLVSKNVLDPVVDTKGWRLRVEGNVRQPLDLSIDDLRALPATEQWATMECISNPIGGNLMGNAAWKGVKLSELLHRAGVGPGAYDVVTTCADGYTESLPLERAMSPELLVVYEMNGEPLTSKHGAPARLQAPGLYGLKSSKWVESIRVANENYLGYWQKEANWTDGAAVYTECRIDRPEDGLAPRGGMLLTGIAYTGLRGVSRVEVSVDDGQSWNEAALEPPLGALTWRLWSYEWRPASPGFYTVKARAYDLDDNPQEESPTVPNRLQVPVEGVIVTGNAGIHGLNLTVKEEE